MPTFKQLISSGKRPLRKYKTRVKDLNKCPQKKGICFKLFIKSPKKPNSAKRKVAKIKLSTKKFVFGYIPGEGNNLQRFSQVLIRGGLIRDLPGVHYTIIRGKLDFHGVYYRRQGRSKYGTKIWWKPKKKDRSSARQVLKKKNADFIQRKLAQQKLRFFRKHFFNWIVFNLYILKDKKKNKFLILPQSFFKLPSFPKIKSKKAQNFLIKSYYKKRNKSIRKYLVKARRHLLRTDFLLNLKLGQPAPNLKKKNTQIRQFATKTSIENCVKKDYKLRYLKNIPLKKNLFFYRFLAYRNNEKITKIKFICLIRYVLVKQLLSVKKNKVHFFVKLKKRKNKVYFTNIKSYKKFYKKQSLTNSYIMDKILRVFLQNGKKSKMENFFNKLTFFIQKEFKITSMFFFVLLLKEITITFELVPMKQAGRILYIPIILSLIRQLTFALKSLKRGVVLRNEQQFFLKLLAECLDILLLQKGLTLTKINKFNELAYLSQPNLHYRWKKKNP